MRKMMAGLLLAVWLLVAASGWSHVMAAEAGAEDSDAELQFTAALIANVAYNGELKELTRNWLMARGWQVLTYHAGDDNTEGRLYVFSHRYRAQEIVFLAFPGTETIKDAKLDLRVTRVPFGGSNPAEFAAQARDLAHKSGDKPLVHQGFNDYVQKVLFSEPLEKLGGITVGEAAAQELQENPRKTLYLTGHSLGGAVATLTAARLADLGVAPEQLKVITFGAPAVGNEAFARAYEHKFSLTRVVMAGDPVNTILQSLSGGFVQFGQRVEWQSKLAERFPHGIAVYLDEAFRHYTDTVPEEQRLRLAGSPQFQLGQPLYVAKPVFKLDKNLRGDLPYMERAVQEITAASFTPLSTAEKASKDLPKLIAEAKAAGSKYILCQQYTGKRIRQERYNFRLTLEEVIYDTEGNVCYLESRSTTTKDLTPVTAAAYLHVQGEEARCQALGVAEAYSQRQQLARQQMNTELNKDSEK